MRNEETNILKKDPQWSPVASRHLPTQLCDFQVDPRSKLIALIIDHTILRTLRSLDGMKKKWFKVQKSLCDRAVL